MFNILVPKGGTANGVSGSGTAQQIAYYTASLTLSSDAGLARLPTGTGQYGLQNAFTSTSASTVRTVAFLGNATTTASAYTTAYRAQFYGDNAAKGAGSTITRDVLYGGVQPTRGTTANCFIADALTATTNYFIYQTSGLPSAFSGRITSSDTTGSTGSTVGSVLVSGGLGCAENVWARNGVGIENQEYTADITGSDKTFFGMSTLGLGFGGGLSIGCNEPVEVAAEADIQTHKWGVMINGTVYYVLLRSL